MKNMIPTLDVSQFCWYGLDSVISIDETEFQSLENGFNILGLKEEIISFTKSSSDHNMITYKSPCGSYSVTFMIG